MTETTLTQYETRRCYLVVLRVLAVGIAVAVASPIWSQDARDRSAAHWKQALQQEDVEARRTAAVSTRACDSETQQQLLPVMIDLLLQESDGQVRLAILDTVADMGAGAESAVPALVHSMKREFRGNGTEKRHQDYRAALALSRVGPAAVESLRGLLSDESSSIRSNAAMALGRIGTAASSAAPELIGLFEDEDSQVRRDAVAALRKIGPAVLPRLLTASGSNKASVQASAIESLALVGLSAQEAQQAVDAAVIAASNADPRVRAAALMTISSLGLPDEVVIPQLSNSLRDENTDVRVVAVNALVRRPSLLPFMTKELTQLLSNPDAGVAWHAAFLLHKQGEAALAIYEQALTIGDASVDVIGRACVLLGRPAVPRLTELLSDRAPKLRQMAALALGDIRPLAQETIAVFANALSDENQAVKMAALAAIRNVGARGQSAVPSVRELLRDDSAEVKIMVVEILQLAAPRDERLIQDLVSTLNASESRVQKHVLDTLRSLGTASRSAIPSVIALLHEPDDDVRGAAAAFLASQGAAAQEAVPVLLAQLRPTTDTEWLVTVIETLGELGAVAQNAAEPLGEQMSDSRATVRLASLKALVSLQLEPEQVHANIVHAFSDADVEVRSQALRSIRRFGRRGVIFIPDLILLSANQRDGESAGRALDRFDGYETDHASIPRLLALTSHKLPQLRRLAAKSLGRVGENDVDVKKKLELLSEDPDADVRDAAAQALQRVLPGDG